MEGIFDTNLKKREQEELIQQAYPMISNIFFDYLSYSPEYANSFSVSCADKFSRLTREDVENIIGREKYFEIEPFLNEDQILREQIGFINGFIYASRLFQETQRT